MSVQKDNNPENPEIDLLTVFSRIGDFFEWINTLLFKIIRFFVKNAIVVVVLVVVGVGVGIFLDKVSCSYEQKIIVTPNFKSTDYLYSKVELLASKLAIKDTLFLKSIGIQNPSDLLTISVKPIVDVYNLMNKDDKNMELLQLMAQNDDLKSIVKEVTTSKNYDLHTIIITTKRIVSPQKTIEPLLKYLNKSTYYDGYNKLNAQNIQNNIKGKEATILQIDRILNRFSSVNEIQITNKNLVYYNENLNLDAVIKMKDSLSGELNKLKLKKYNTNNTIKEMGMVLNVKSSKILKGKSIFILPIVFVGLFVLFSFFISFYKKQSLKANSSLE
ncbi:hypothetical protein MCETHM1_00266 [Flavobacteriaceae bacterium]|jgi:hypothetical protein